LSCILNLVRTIHLIQQLVSGVSILAYWTTTFLWDFLTYQISMWCCIWIFAGFNVVELIGTPETIRATILLFFFHGIAAAGMTYVLSFLYKSPSSAQNTMIFINVSAVDRSSGCLLSRNGVDACVKPRLASLVSCAMVCRPDGGHVPAARLVHHVSH
jgi:hypothetical protein